MTTEVLIRSAGEPSGLAPAPIRSEWIIDGQPVARLELLSTSADGTASTYYWDCTAGRFNWYYAFDETLHILEGSVALKEPSGRTRRVTAGDVVFFPAGSSAEWTVDTYIKKLAFCRTPLPTYFLRFRALGRSLKRLTRGGSKEPETSGLL